MLYRSRVAAPWLVASWGGVPEHLTANFSRYLKKDGPEGAPEVDLSGGSAQPAEKLAT